MKHKQPPPDASPNPESPQAPAESKGVKDTQQRPLCFVIGPIDQPGTEVRKRANMLLRYIIKPAFEDKYIVKRADEDAKPGSITDQMIVDINRADLLIADLSNLNPNALYELGVAHALGKRIIHMSDSEELPFDIRDYRAVFFDPTDPDRHDRSILELRAAEQSLVVDENPLNPVSRALGRHEIIKRQDAERSSMEQLFQDVDMLKYKIGKMDRDRAIIYRTMTDYTPSLFDLPVLMDDKISPAARLTLKIKAEILETPGVKSVEQVLDSKGESVILIKVTSSSSPNEIRRLHQKLENLGVIRWSHIQIDRT